MSQLRCRLLSSAVIASSFRRFVEKLHFVGGFGSRAAGVALTMVCIASSVAATCDEILPVEVLPVAESCATWAPVGDPGTAQSFEELARIINGGAGLYVEYGFVAAVFQNYVGEIETENVDATLILFNQGSTENATALYGDENSGIGTPVDDWTGSGEARISQGLTSVMFQFHEECFFVSVTLFTSSEAGEGEARCLAESTVELIQGALPIEITSWGQIKTNYQKPKNRLLRLH